MYNFELAGLQRDGDLKGAFDAKGTVKFYAGLTNPKYSIFKKLSPANNNSVRHYVRFGADFLKNEAHEIKPAFPTNR